MSTLPLFGGRHKPDLTLQLRDGAEVAGSLECGCEVSAKGRSVWFTFCATHRRATPMKKDPDWLAAALDAVRLVASRCTDFTTGEVWEAIGDSLRVGDPRSMGNLMEAAGDAGMVEKTDAHRKSRRPACHGRMVRVWRSLIFKK